MATGREAKRILVIKLRHIGDVLLTAPVFRALKERFPAAYVAAAVNAGTEEMLSGNPHVDDIIILDRGGRGGLKKAFKEAAFLAGIRKKRFDTVVDLTCSDRSAILSFLSGAGMRVASEPLAARTGFKGKKHLYTHLTKINDLHMVAQNLEFLKPLGAGAGDPAFDLFIPQEAKDFVGEIFKKHGINDTDRVVHVHPASRWQFKCWKDDRMAGVITRLMEKGVKVVLTSSPDKKEMARAGKILSIASKSPAAESCLVDLCGKIDLKRLAAVSAASSLFLGVDSAPMHMAAAVGTPVVALFGPSILWRWAPWDAALMGVREARNIKTFYGDGVYRIGRHAVIQRRWDCVPCRKDGCDGTKVSGCIDDITTDEVAALVLDGLAAR